ncbi:MAG: hydroxymethylglutaryl-CoA synthase [Bacteroidetes bacterium CG02_land_8_20_14_3_00_31_25]|nr:hydroxymethylglutaryl-CoA synthase [Bacteroidota bacterium]PIV57735.1 MAG: hydroxymethylglutaryl-CoA synthase [Bacteroidetes bacterium CG02_land_8_20_14_3_00_31_25]PIX36336.1 MAG: hydroxymethylglutaryl-CoA synthase [Bacteroidetes bacterium CG_4_8_14_3_um_filter_31_14]PIY04071.1 MAG: hydroxymethylglutaryl-CoA synthase [Bacteroidetes bacterium CG_4_10_14_3_um_filter_31_20]
MVGIVGYGTQIPRYRIKIEEIAKVWGADAASFKRGLNLNEKSVPYPDEDCATLAVNAARNAMSRAGINPQEIGALYVGSESHPYAVKPTGATVSEALGACPYVHTADFEFACKAGTEAMFVALNLVKSGAVKYAIGIGSDTSQGSPGDALEYSASAGAAAYVMGAENLVAELIDTHCFMTDTPDFWRREHANYPEHGGRFTGEPSYMKHVSGAVNAILEKTKMKPEDFDYMIFHQPNGKFPVQMALKLGFKEPQFRFGLLTPTLGNTYSGSSPLGLAATLDEAKPNQLILLVSYGSGAGSDAFIFKTTERLLKVRDMAPRVRKQLDEHKMYLEYGQYAKFRHKIVKPE